MNFRKKILPILTIAVNFFIFCQYHKCSSFNICENKYRLIVKIHYGIGIVYIRFIGTHSQYDRINANEV
ncbi:MAG: type II toxin-antitoxin system HigB family toxin [Leptospiraceae bacterium]|nr:type II toxin-antitoxin system HigB family toxin [Leptospiraceae bacterium]